jgi:leader peptidase (prepilin peptidase)/N-methyltransferase
MSFGAVGQITAAVAVIAWLAALSVVDLREHRLPNALTLPGAVVILTVAAVGGRGLPAAAGAAALAGAYLVVHLIAPAAMGAGDVKLALGLGALTGALSVDVWALAALGAPVLTAAWGLVSGLRRVPHGPSMCLATALVIWAC